MEKSQKIIVETRLGSQTIDPEKVITFPRGLIGFENQKEFTLIKVREDSPFLLLQSLNDSTLGLLVTDPYLFLDTYQFIISDAEQRLLQIQSVKELAVVVTVTIPHGNPELTTLNLTGPIFVNHEKRIGIQVPQSNSDMPRLYLHKKN